MPDPVDPEQEAQLDRELQELREQVTQVGAHVMQPPIQELLRISRCVQHTQQCRGREGLLYRVQCMGLGWLCALVQQVRS